MERESPTQPLYAETTGAKSWSARDLNAFADSLPPSKIKELMEAEQAERATQPPPEGLEEPPQAPAQPTASRRLRRLTRPRFAGEVERGGRYVIVVDVIVSGSSAAELPATLPHGRAKLPSRFSPESYFDLVAKPPISRERSTAFADAYRDVCPKAAGLIFSSGAELSISYLILDGSIEAKEGNDGNSSVYVIANQACRYTVTMKKFFSKSGIEIRSRYSAPLWRTDSGSRR